MLLSSLSRFMLAPCGPCKPCRASQFTVFAGRGGAAEPFDAFERRALREAAEALAIAQEQAQQQARDELISSWQASSTFTADDQPPTSPPAVLEAFVTEQGLLQSQASKLSSVLHADAQLKRFCSVNSLGQQLGLLQRVLPDAEVAALVLQEPQLLLASGAQLVNNLVALVNALPAGCDVTSMCIRRPQLLLVEDMQARLQRIIAKLVALHPSHSHAIVGGIIEENPDLVFRMDYYLSENIQLLDELPIEIQNMMVLGDHGVGFLYKYWNDRLQDPPDQQEWDSSSSSSGAP